MKYLGLIIDDSAKVLMTGPEIVLHMTASIEKVLKELKNKAYLIELEAKGFYHRN